MANTRFVSTLNTGPAHAGHLFTLFANYLHAKKTMGNAFFCADMPNDLLESNDFVKENLYIFGRLGILNDNVLVATTHLNPILNRPAQTALFHQMMKGTGIPAIPEMFCHSHRIRALYDFYLEIDILIRGDDWKWDAMENGTSPCSPQHKMGHICWLNELNRRVGKRPVEEIFLPCVVNSKGDKLSSSNIDPENKLVSFAKEIGFDLACLNWFVEKWEGKKYNPENLSDYWKSFELSFCPKNAVVYDKDEFECHIHEIKKMDREYSKKLYYKAMNLVMTDVECNNLYG